MPSPGQTGQWRHHILRLFVHLSVLCLLVCYQTLTRYVENESTNFDANWHKWSAGQGHETFNFGSQEVKRQGHMRPK